MTDHAQTEPYSSASAVQASISIVWIFAIVFARVTSHELHSDEVVLFASRDQSNHGILTIQVNIHS